MYNRKRRSPMTLGEVMMFAAGTLFCLVLITTAMMGGLFARYTATAEGSDSARVAGFDVKVTGPAEGVTCIVTASHPGEITLTVDNDSEVAVSYKLRIAINETVGCGVRVTLDKEKTLEFPAKEKTELEYDIAGSLAVGADPVTHTLAFEPLDWKVITEAVTGEQSQAIDQPFTVYVDVVQVD